MSEAANKALVRRFFESALSAGDLTAAGEIFAADYGGHDPNVPPLPPGPEGVALFAFGSRVAFPDQQVRLPKELGERESSGSQEPAPGRTPAPGAPERTAA
jgi:hypothetical protein